MRQSVPIVQGYLSPRACRHIQVLCRYPLGPAGHFRYFVSDTPAMMPLRNAKGGRAVHLTILSLLLATFARPASHRSPSPMPRPRRAACSIRRGARPATDRGGRRHHRPRPGEGRRRLTSEQLRGKLVNPQKLGTPPGASPTSVTSQESEIDALTTFLEQRREPVDRGSRPATTRTERPARPARHPDQLDALSSRRTACHRRPTGRPDFGRSAPLALEIGCGTGHFILQRASQQPETDFLAIDIYNKGCLKTCSKLDAAGRDQRPGPAYRGPRTAGHSHSGRQSAGHLHQLPRPLAEETSSRPAPGQSGFSASWPCSRLAPDGDFFFSSDSSRLRRRGRAACSTGIPGFCNQLPVAVCRAIAGIPALQVPAPVSRPGLPVHFVHHRRDPAVDPPAHVPPPDSAHGFRAGAPGSRHA